jgi:hypothetical protein
VVADEQVLGEDFLDLLDALEHERVDHLIVGAHALSVYGISRATGDLDVFIRPSPETAERIVRALQRFGAPLEAHALTERDFLRPGWVYQMGLPPWRIDILTSISGVSFDEAWEGRKVVHTHGRRLQFIGLRELKANKRAAGRPKDLLDLDQLDACAMDD